MFRHWAVSSGRYRVLPAINAPLEYPLRSSEQLLCQVPVVSFVWVRSRPWHCEVFCCVIRQNKNYFSTAVFKGDPRHIHCRSQWPRGLRFRPAAARLLRLWVRIPPRAWMSVLWVLCVVRGICDGLITRPEESYRLCCVVVWSRKPREWGGPVPLGGCRTKYQNKKVIK